MQTITRTIRPAALAAQLNLRLLVLGLLLSEATPPGFGRLARQRSPSF
ncbi:MAG: hypothetical protein ACR2GQ_09195 [Gemmatimonadota bacterium]|jgi:hypothetical protein